jgi:hypothetical protein
VSVLSEHVEQTKQAVGSGLPVLPRVNLLPPEIGERIRFRRIQYGLGGGLLAAVGVVALLLVGANGDVSDAESEVATATAAGDVLRVETAKYAEVKAVYAQAAASEAMLTQAMGDTVEFSNFLYGLGLTIPENVWIRSATFKQAPVAPALGSTEPGIGEVTFTGVGYKHDDVAVWLESLVKQTGYANPYFTDSTKAFIGSRSVVNFSSSVVITPAALSRRYTSPAGG